MEIRIGPVAGLRPEGGAGRDKVESAAQDFEALLIAQMLRQGRAVDGAGWLGTGEDESAATMVEMAEELLAQTLARRGGLGLASVVARQLSRTEGPAGTQ